MASFHFLKAYRGYTIYNMKPGQKSGFTLVELMVIIAIIAILASIVLTSLATARTKSQDSAAKSEISQERGLAELQYDTTANYDFICNPGTDTYKLFVAAIENGSRTPGSAYCLSSSLNYLILGVGGVLISQSKLPTPGKWAIGLQLKGGTYFCTDYTGIILGTSTLTISPTDLNCD